MRIGWRCLCVKEGDGGGAERRLRGGGDAGRRRVAIFLLPAMARNKQVGNSGRRGCAEERECGCGAESALSPGVGVRGRAERRERIKCGHVTARVLSCRLRLANLDSLHSPGLLTRAAKVPTFILAGNETTSTVVSRTLFELAQHANVQAQLRAELRGFPLPAAAAHNAPLDADTLAGARQAAFARRSRVREPARAHAGAERGPRGHGGHGDSARAVVHGQARRAASQDSREEGRRRHALRWRRAPQGAHMRLGRALLACPDPETSVLTHSHYAPSRSRMRPLAQYWLFQRP
jgi:hypothetical protein